MMAHKAVVNKHLSSVKFAALALACAGLSMCVQSQAVWAASTDTTPQQAAPSFTPHTKVGQRMPAFTVKEISGKNFSMTHERGKVVVVNFWATWCPPCRVEMPKLEQEIWEKYKTNPHFAMVAIARQQSEATIADFAKTHAQFTYPLAYDPDRKVYAKFADAGIPRSYVVDKHGKIVFQSLGYQTGDIVKLNRAVQKALAE